MTYEDLTPDEREALELLRGNAPEAPTALASLDEAGRARVLEALSTQASAPEPDDPVAPSAVDGSANEAPDDEPALEDAPVSQPSSPTTFADRLLAQKVTVADKQVPLVPSAVGLVLLLVAVILLVRACGGGGDPLEALAERGMEAVDNLDDHADKVGDDRLFDAADRVRDDMRTLMSAAEADDNDFDEMLEAGDAVAELGTELLDFVEIAADLTGQVRPEEAIRAAAHAARDAGQLLTNDDVLDQAESFAKKLLDTHIEENARRTDSEEVREFRRAAEDLMGAARRKLVTRVNSEMRRAELWADHRTVEWQDSDERDASLDETNDILQELWAEAWEASEDYDQAVDDFCYFEERVEWRGSAYPSCQWEAPPF